MCRQAMFPKELLGVVTKNEFVKFGKFLEAQGGGAGNGTGFISTNGRAMGIKGVDVTWEEIYDWLIQSQEKIDEYVIIHTRIPSVGRKMDALCHPFTLNPNKEFKATGPTAAEDFDAYEIHSRHQPTVLAFNGTWVKWKDVYFPLASAGYPLPWYGFDDLSDALIMAWSVFAFGVKVLPAFDAGATLILQPDYPVLVVARDTVLKYCEYRGIPMYTSAIPKLKDITTLRNVKKGVYPLYSGFVLEEDDFAEYTSYGNVTKWNNTRASWTQSKCDICEFVGSVKIFGEGEKKGKVCWRCRSQDDFDEDEFIKTHLDADTKEEDTDELQEYSAVKVEENNDTPFVSPARTPIITPDTGGCESPFLEEITIDDETFINSSMVDARFPRLRETQDGGMVWLLDSDACYYLEKAEGAFTDTMLVKVETNVLSYIVYHKPEWGAVWADLEAGNFVVWDVLGIGTEEVGAEVGVYYLKQADDGGKTIGKLTSSWKVFVNEGNAPVYNAWGLVYSFESLVAWLDRASQRNTQSDTFLEILYRGPKNLSTEEKFLLEYFRVHPRPDLPVTDIPFGVCEICEKRQAARTYNETEICDVCSKRYGIVVMEGRVVT